MNIIESFYRSFAELDAEGMAACYHADIQFEDPAFGQLKGEHAKNMWRMLCKSQKDKGFKLTYSQVEFNDKSGSARWEARYTFSKANRRVHNIISAKFEFKDGLIVKHQDHFDLYKWARQALGLTGVLIGWTPFFKQKLNRQTNQLLRKFEEKLNEGGQHH